MLERLLTTVISDLGSLGIFNQIEAYEGHFDNPDEFLLKPPCCFVEFSSGRADGVLGRSSVVSVDLYLTCNHIKGKLNVAMLDMIERVKGLFNQNRIAQTGYMHFLGFDRLGIFPGFCSYRVSFEFKEDL